MELTREQVRAKLSGLEMSTAWKGVVRPILAHDQALRERVAGLERERDEAVKQNALAAYNALLKAGHTKDEHTAEIMGNWLDAIQQLQQLRESVTRSRSDVTQAQQTATGLRVDYNQAYADGLHYALSVLKEGYTKQEVLELVGKRYALFNEPQAQRGVGGEGGK